MQTINPQSLIPMVIETTGRGEQRLRYILVTIEESDRISWYSDKRPGS